MIYLAWKVLGTTQSFSLTGKACHPKCFYLYIFRFELWHLYKSLLPSTKGLSIYFMQFLFWVSIFSYKAPTKGHYDCIWALGVANNRVCFMNGSMVEHNGLGITCFMLIFWKTWLLVDMLEYWNRHVKTRLLPHQKKKYVMNMLGIIPHQFFCFYHLPTRGWVGVKLGDADTSPTYL